MNINDQATKRPDAPAERGLRQEHSLCRASERTRFCEGEKMPELDKCHVRALGIHAVKAWYL